ncbi:unnamed protein product [Brassica oleracea var. botrytis]
MTLQIHGDKAKLHFPDLLHHHPPPHSPLLLHCLHGVGSGASFNWITI